MSFCGWQGSKTVDRRKHCSGDYKTIGGTKGLTDRHGCAIRAACCKGIGRENYRAVKEKSWGIMDTQKNNGSAVYIKEIIDTCTSLLK